MMLIFIGVVPVMIIATLSGPGRRAEADSRRRRFAGRLAQLRDDPRQDPRRARSIVTGMRVAVGVSWTSIVAAEMIAADQGIGYVILEAGNYLDTAMVFSSIVLIGSVGLVMDRALQDPVRGWIRPNSLGPVQSPDGWFNDRRKDTTCVQVV